ncbi:uncharacterized protein [Bemisia tabaci]|uniref:uncharacterized protein isoform X1 n=1 Tax=Bemisia tabaci TaxID=7038 RepID=UPI003B283B9E
MEDKGERKKWREKGQFDCLIPKRSKGDLHSQRITKIKRKLEDSKIRNVPAVLISCMLVNDLDDKTIIQQVTEIANPPPPPPSTQPPIIPPPPPPTSQPLQGWYPYGYYPRYYYPSPCPQASGPPSAVPAPEAPGPVTEVAKNENLFKEFLDYKRRYQEKEVTETAQEEGKKEEVQVPKKEEVQVPKKEAFPPLKKKRVSRLLFHLDYFSSHKYEERIS